MAESAGRCGRGRVGLAVAVATGVLLVACGSATRLGHLDAATRTATNPGGANPGGANQPAAAPAATRVPVTSHPPVAPNGAPLGKLSTPGTPKGEQTVPLLVIATRGQQKRSTFALIPVYIDGRGPFPFALDTGASRSLIATGLAALLHLPDRGSAGKLYGVVGGANAENMYIADWRAGSIKLPSEVVTSLGTPGSAQPTSASQTVQDKGPMGLLGSDVLSRYGKIAVDYDKGFLILDPPVK